ncbi:MAG: histidinol dehydrogenase [Dehalococcoidia bacterium]|nr:histidinol dehydrogenase [Dehalococcoidia bacterium]
MKVVRGLQEARSLFADRRRGGAADTGISIERRETVARIVNDVRARGDRAVREHTEKIDGVRLDGLEVSRQEIESSPGRIDSGLREALELAARRVRAFHEMQMSRLGLAFEERGLGFTARAVRRVGVYVPGGKASYPSSVIMTAPPARAAGVEEIVVCTPPSPDGTVPLPTLAAAAVAGVDRVFGVGGAQAIAALAYGTETVPAVDKICGPGNVYVTLAKKMVFGTVGIDGLHGPTETMVLADDSADPTLCAADLLAQAEHDEMASAVFVTTSPGLAERVSKELEVQAERLARKEIVRRSLENNGVILIVSGLDEAMEAANLYAPEHLCLAVRDPRACLDRVRNAGGVFIDSPEAVGDYTAGPSHVMPTGGTARFSSPLSVLDFLKLSIVVDIDRESLEALGPAAAMIARAEGLEAHAISIEKRLGPVKRDTG